MAAVERVLERLSAWLEAHVDAKWWRRIDTFNRVVWTTLVVLFALVGAAIAGWALTHGPWGILFAAPVAFGAYLALKYAR